jgi:hypothetical protein
MQEILSKRHYRRPFFTTVLVVLAFALLVRFLVLPQYDPSLSLSFSAFLASLLDNLVVSIFITVLIGGFIFWITPDIVRRSQLEILEPKRISPLLKEAAATSKFWIYKGACGRYTRAVTLPLLADAARVEGIGRDITVCILDPRNHRLCAAYATYRKSLRSRTETLWSPLVVQEEVLATAVLILKYQFSEPLLRINLFFVNSFSAFRLDISDRYVIVTKEDIGASALKADAGTYFYDSYKDDVRLTERLATQLPYSPDLEFTSKFTESSLLETIKQSKLVDESTLQQLNISRLLETVNTPTSPY